MAYTTETSGDDQIIFFGETESGGNTFATAMSLSKYDEEWKLRGSGIGDDYLIDSSGIIHNYWDCPEVVDRSDIVDTILLEKEARDKGYKRCKECL